MKKVAAATAEYRESVRLSRNSFGGHYDLAYPLHQQGLVDEARAEYRVSLTLAPDWPRGFLREAWTMATDPDPRKRNGLWAVQNVEKVRQAEGDRNPQVLDTLAAALAESGQFDKAVTTARAALERARADGQAERVKEIQGRIALYERRQAWRGGDAR